MKIVDCDQRSPEWYAARRGIPTASEFGSIIQPVKMGYAAAADEYINRLIDEVMRPEATGSFTGNRHTERGCALEPEAREVYAFERDVVLRQCGFILNDNGLIGCSPDSLILSADPATNGQWEGGLEVKCPDGPTHLKWLRAGKIPAEHMPQVHGSLIVTRLPWWDFMSYCPPYPPLIVRAVPGAFTEALRACLERFLGEYTKAREQIEAMA